MKKKYPVSGTGVPPVFPKWNAVRTELSWTHYRALIRIDNTEARQWYMEEN